MEPSAAEQITEGFNFTRVSLTVDPSVANVSGKYFSSIAKMKTPYVFAQDEQLAAELWKLTEEIISNF